MGGRRKRDIVNTVRPLARCQSELHGVAHWARVCRFGEYLARRMLLPDRYAECVSVFAWTHDLARINDEGGREHAIDGACYLDTVAPIAFPSLLPEQHAIVRTAIHYHSHGCATDEAKYQGWFEGLEGDRGKILDTVACCWDADRLDLLRLGFEPDPARMSTPYWDELVPLAKRLNRFDRLWW